MSLNITGPAPVPASYPMMQTTAPVPVEGGVGGALPYEAVEWPIIILLGALIPVSEAVRETGGTELIAFWLAQAAAGLPALGGVALTLLAAMALTPFLNNAATVLVMAPVAASLASHLGLSPDPFLMAVAVGAACDFLTPIGHQCNTLVMGRGAIASGIIGGSDCRCRS